jgi:hypothetical protein
LQADVTAAAEAREDFEKRLAAAEEAREAAEKARTAAERERREVEAQALVRIPRQ